MQGPSTRAVHGGETPDPRTGAVNVPVHLTSTYWYPELPGGGKSDYIYSRYTNPSVEAVEAKVALLDAAEGSLLFSTGMAAITTLCTSLLAPGDTIATQRGIYGGTMAYLSKELARFGVKVQPLDAVKPPTAKSIPEGTRIVWMESITNPLLRVGDVKAWAKAAHDAGALLAVDATFASPLLQQPLKLGADLVMHSGTKYLGGHTDLLAGALSWKKGFDPEPIWRNRRNTGPTLDPQTAYLLGRGMKTLAIRMERHCTNALAFAQACEGIAGIKAVHYPGLESHPDHATAKRVLTGGFGGVVTLDFGTLKAAQSFRRNLKLIIPASSLGGVESLVSLPLETSHQYATTESRRADGVGDGLARVSVGIEDIADLIADAQQAIKATRKVK